MIYMPFSKTRRLFSGLGWSLPVSPRGTLRARLTKPCVFNITPLNPHVSEWNSAEILVNALDQKGSIFWQSERIAREFGLSASSRESSGENLVLLQTETVERSTTCDKPSTDATVVVDVRVPGLLALDIETCTGSVSINGTIEGDVKVHSDDADVSIEKLKSMKVDISSKGGNISAQVLQGTVAISSDNGNISIGKMQGPGGRIRTRSGHVCAKAMYTDQAMITTESGDIMLKGAQGSIHLITKNGLISAAGIQGSFDVESESSSIDVQLSRPKKVSLQTGTGAIRLGLSETVVCEMNLEAESIHVDDRVTLTDVQWGRQGQILQARLAPSGSDFSSPNHRRHSAHIFDHSDELSSPKVQAYAPQGKLDVIRTNWADQFK